MTGSSGCAPPTAAPPPPAPAAAAAPPPACSEGVKEGWGDCRAREVPHEVEFRLRRPDGSYSLILSRAVPVLNADGTLREWVGTTPDITAPRAAEQPAAPR